MNELKKNRLALIGVTREIQKIFSLGEVNDTLINKLKIYIEYYEQLQEELDILKKNYKIDSDPETENFLDMLKRSVTNAGNK